MSKEVETMYDEFFGTGYWEEQYKKHICIFADKYADQEIKRDLRDKDELEKSISAGRALIDRIETLCTHHEHASLGHFVNKVMEVINEVSNNNLK